MNRIAWVIIILLFIQPFQLFAMTKRWNGSVSDQWSDLHNWTPEGVPSETDEVILDNRFIENDYDLVVPPGTTSLLSLDISPAAGRKIALKIPSSNNVVPAMALLGTGNCLIIRAGGILRNSSGLTSGQSLLLTGKMAIFDGGAYVHNSRASHATGIVARLSTEPGTDKGLFEFNVPGGAYSLSMSNRNYGSLKLSSSASDESQTYNATGTSVSNVRGDLHIGRGVTLNLDLEKTLTVGGDFRQEVSILNLANQPNNLQFTIRGDLYQDSLAQITETSSGLPLLVFEGSSRQTVSLKGIMTNSVGMLLRNSAGILLHDDLNVSFGFRFQSGKIVSGKPGLLRVGSQAWVEGASPDSFVDGPVAKSGAADFTFPVGRQLDFAPFTIKGASANSLGSTTVTYHHGNPAEVFGAEIRQNDALRISSLEYWTVERSEMSTGVVSLEVGAYSHATALNKLVIMGWDKQLKRWASRGNSASSGIATGQITSEWNSLDAVYTLGTTVPDQNPLPVYFEELVGMLSHGEVTLAWKAHNQTANDRFVIEYSANGFDFSRLAVIEGAKDTMDHVHRLPWTKDGYFRVRLLATEGKEVQSQTVYLASSMTAQRLMLYPLPAGRFLNVSFSSARTGEANMEVISLSGRRYSQSRFALKPGKNEYTISLDRVPSGYYVLRVSVNNESFSRIFIKF